MTPSHTSDFPQGGASKFRQVQERIWLEIELKSEPQEEVTFTEEQTCVFSALSHPQWLRAAAPEGYGFTGGPVPHLLSLSADLRAWHMELDGYVAQEVSWEWMWQHIAGTLKGVYYDSSATSMSKLVNKFVVSQLSWVVKAWYCYRNELRPWGPDCLPRVWCQTLL